MEFETAGDLKVAVDKLDTQDFKGANVRCVADVRFIQLTRKQQTSTNQLYRRRTRFLAMIAIVLVPPHRSVVETINLLITIMIAEARLHHEATALAETTIAVDLHRRVMTTILVTAAIVPRSAPLARLWMTPTHLLVVAIATIPMLLRLRVVDTTILTLPTVMTDLEPGHHQGRTEGVMMSAVHQDTGDCSLSFVGSLTLQNSNAYHNRTSFALSFKYVNMARCLGWKRSRWT